MQFVLCSPVTYFVRLIFIFSVMQELNFLFIGVILVFFSFYFLSYFFSLCLRFVILWLCASFRTFDRQWKLSASRNSRPPIMFFLLLQAQSYFWLLVNLVLLVAFLIESLAFWCFHLLSFQYIYFWKEVFQIP